MSAELTKWVNRTNDRVRRLTPIYARAVEEGSLQDIILIRGHLVAIVLEADRIITDHVYLELERRIRDDG